MNTGYDNYWMHSRPNPVLNLPKNDNYSCALLPDSYKHMQNRGCPGYLNNFVPPQNIAASSHERDRYRNSHDQSMWPSSVYSHPYTPSYANNLHPQEPFFNHTNSCAYSSPNLQAQEKHGYRHLEMPNSNVNIPTMHTNTTTHANNGLAHAQNNKRTNTQVPRIRVKDVFSLNNQSIQGQLHLDGRFGTRQQRDPRVHSAHCNRALRSQIQTEAIRYKSANLVQSSNLSHFEHRNTEAQTRLNAQEQFQNSCSIYQQNNGSSLGELNGGRQIENNISSESLQSRTPASLCSQLHRNTEAQTRLNAQEQFQNSCSIYQQNNGSSQGELSGGRRTESNISSESLQSRTSASLHSQLHRNTEAQSCLNTQEQFQNSCSVYQQNNDSSQGELNAGRRIESNISSESLQSRTPASLHSQLHRNTEAQSLNTQEQFQNSCSVYQQNNISSLGELNGGRQIESNISSENLQSRTPASLLSQLLTQGSIPERGLQSCQEVAGGHGNAQPGHGGEKAMPMRNLAELQDPKYSDSNYSRSCGLNERAPENSTSLRKFNNVHCDLQENLTKSNEANLKSQNSASPILEKNAPSITSKSLPLKEINNQQNSAIKIRIPNTGKSSIIGLNGSEDTERNSAVHLQNFLEQSDKSFVVERSIQNTIHEENGVVNSIPPPVEESSFISHHTSSQAASIPESSGNEGDVIAHKNSVPVSSSLMSSPRNCQEDTTDQQPCLQEFDVLSSKDGDFFQYSPGAPEIIQQKFAMEISRQDNSTTERGMASIDFTATPLKVKQESFHSEIESASLLCAQNPPEGKEFRLRIKTEENNKNLGARECELGVLPPDIIKKTLEEFLLEGFGNSADKSRSDSAPVADSEDHSDKVNTLKSSSSKRGDVQEHEKEKEGKEVSLSSAKYKSKINRDKLDLLIQFLKKEQDSDDSNSCKEGQNCRETISNAGSDSHRDRRKLNKASIVRNKNNSREMVSLMSPKGLNFTCKAPQIRNKNSEKTEDGKSSCSKDGGAMVEESVDITKERMKCNNPYQENESKKGDSSAGSNNEAAGLSKGHFQESPEKAASRNKCAAQDENAVISTVRTFQNSKTHFCLSCKLVSSIESFWINVVSGEVKCLNCFKGKMLKNEAKENVLNSKSNDLHDSSVKSPGIIKHKTEKKDKSQDSAAVSGSNSWNEGEKKRSSKCEDALRKLNAMKENVRRELLEMFVWENHKSSERKHMTNSFCRTNRSNSGSGVDSQKGKPSEEKVLKTEKSARTDIYKEEVGRRFSENGTNQRMKDINATRKRKSFSGEEDFANRERQERQPSSIKQRQTTIPKEQYSEGGAKEETVIKSDKSHGRRSSRGEEGPENKPKTEWKGVASITRRSSDDTREEFRCQRMSVIEERGQKDLKVRHLTDESRKLLSREDRPAGKDYAAEEAAKRHRIDTGRETSDKSTNQNIRKEDRLKRDQKRSSEAKTSKLFPWRDLKVPDGLARSTSKQNGVEYQKRMESTEQSRKRKYSDEGFNTHKIQTLEDFVKKYSEQATHPSKSSETKVSKENDNSQRGNLWSARISLEKSERSDAPKEECVLIGEYFRKEAKPPPEGEKAKVKDLWKGPVASQRAKPPEPAKGRPTGFAEHSRMKSKDEQLGHEKAIGSRRKSESSEGPKRRRSEEESGVPGRASAMKLFSCSSGPYD